MKKLKIKKSFVDFSTEELLSYSKNKEYEVKDELAEKYKSMHGLVEDITEEEMVEIEDTASKEETQETESDEVSTLKETKTKKTTRRKTTKQKEETEDK